MSGPALTAARAFSPCTGLPYYARKVGTQAIRAICSEPVLPARPDSRIAGCRADAGAQKLGGGAHVRWLQSPVWRTVSCDWLGNRALSGAISRLAAALV